MTLIEEMEMYAHEHDVPIMQKEGIDFMCSFLKEHNLKHVLEIGSAIGYSAIRMAMLDMDIQITTIERGLQDRITLLFGDALETVVEGSFDMLFIDAAKAQYTKFFERYEPLLKKGGYVITDNLKFHGLVEHPENIKSRNLRSLVRKIGNFVEYLKQREDYDTQFYDFGDGVGISRKKV